MKVFPIADNSGRWGIGPFSPKVQALSRVIPGLLWSREHQAYIGYRDAIKLTLVSLGFAIDGQDLFESSASGPLVYVGRVNEKGLRDYQKEGVKFLLQRGREGCILADHMGLGKTCQALTAAKIINRKTLIVCPNYVRGVWLKELEKWWPRGLKNVACPAGIKDVSQERLECGEGPPQIVIIHYDILHAWAQVLDEWGPEVVIFDEAHVLQGERTLRSKAARCVSEGASYRIGLTGTPMTSRPQNLWNIVDILSPGRFGSYFDFGKRHCDAFQTEVAPGKIVWDFKGKSHEEELRARLSYFMLRRLVLDVALELPPKTRQIVNVDVGGLGSTTGNVTSVNMRRWLDVAADKKLPEAWEIIKNHLEGGHSIVAFCWRRQVAEWISDQAKLAGFAAPVVHGGISAHRRGLAIESAKGHKDQGVVLCATIDSCSTGIDLSFADVGVFVELSYKPHDLLQAEARLHRFGQQNPTLIQYIIAQGSTDELVAHIVIDKLDTFEKVVGATGESLGKDLQGTEENVLEQLAKAIERMK